MHQLRGVVGCRVCCALAEPGGLAHEVIPFRQARRPAGGNPVVCNRGRMVAGHFEQMGTNGVEAMMAGQPSIGIQSSQQLESFGRAVHHGCGDSVIEHHHGIVGHTFEKVIER